MKLLYRSLFFFSALALNLHAQENAKTPAPLRADEVKRLSRESLKRRGVVDLGKVFYTGHPQGLVKLGNTFYMTAVNDVKDKATDGFILAFTVEADGRAKEQGWARLNQEGGQIHPGSIEVDPLSHRLITSVGEYRPSSSSSLLSIDPLNLHDIQILGKISDHIGTLFGNYKARKLALLNWDSEQSYSVDYDSLKGQKIEAAKVDLKKRLKTSSFQDCKSLEEGYALCSGTKPATLSLVQIDDYGEIALKYIIDVPSINDDDDASEVKMFGGNPLTRNPLAIEVIEENGQRKLILHFIPYDKSASKLVTYEAVLN